MGNFVRMWMYGKWRVIEIVGEGQKRKEERVMVSMVKEDRHPMIRKENQGSDWAQQDSIHKCNPKSTELPAILSSASVRFGAECL